MIRIGDLSIATLDDVSFREQRVLLRVDFNSPVSPETGELLDDTRIRAHKDTILELVEGKAAVAIISHQGRPFDKDFTSLQQHSLALSEILGRDVIFVEDVCFESAIRAVKNLRPGEILLLENVRLLSEEVVEETPENHARSYLVSRLSRYFTLFVNDAFSACHRSQASLVGFPLRLPSVAGRLMERELRALAVALRSDLRPKVLVVGGSKVDDALKTMEKALAKDALDFILTTGVVALTLLASRGTISSKLLPKQARDERILDTAGRLMERYEGRIMTPVDFLVESRDGVMPVSAGRAENLPKDIGPETVRMYGDILDKAKLIVMKGPAGVIEDSRFRKGTEVLVAKALSSNAYTIFGGGHLLSVVESMPFELKSRAGHLSVAGGALLYALAGEKLPCLEALHTSARVFNMLSRDSLSTSS